MLIFADYFLAVFHVGLTLFNLIGWASVTTRRIHMVTLLLTLCSWLLMGIWKGMGYCLVTDVHWEIKRRLGQHVYTGSCIKYYLDMWTGADFTIATVNVATTIAMVALVVITVYMNFIRPKLTASR